MYRVLVTEWASDGVHLVGHNKAYEQVLLPPRHDLLGHMVDVRIVSVGKFYMEGVLLDESPRTPVAYPPLPSLAVERHALKKMEGSGDVGDNEGGQTADVQGECAGQVGAGGAGSHCGPAERCDGVIVGVGLGLLAVLGAIVVRRLLRQ